MKYRQKNKKEEEEVLDTFLKFIKALRWKRKKLLRFFLVGGKGVKFSQQTKQQKGQKFFCVLIAIKSNVINHSFWCLCLSIESIKTRPRSINHNIYIYVGKKALQHYSRFFCSKLTNHLFQCWINRGILFYVLYFVFFNSQ